MKEDKTYTPLGAEQFEHPARLAHEKRMALARRIAEDELEQYLQTLEQTCGIYSDDVLRQKEKEKNLIRNAAGLRKLCIFINNLRQIRGVNEEGMLDPNDFL